MKKDIVSVLITAIVAGGSGFYGGMQYAGTKAPAGQGSQQAGRQFGAGGATTGARGSRQGNGGFVTGDIIAKDDKSITLKVNSGGSKIVFYADSTEVGKFVNGTHDDLAIGKTVMVNGKANSDGSVTAQSIQLRPARPASQSGQNQKPAQQ